MGIAQNKTGWTRDQTKSSERELSDFAQPSGVFERLKYQFKVEQLNNMGLPSRFSCIHMDDLQNKTLSSVWAHRLSDLLGVSLEKSIAFKEISQETDMMGNVHLKYEQVFGAYPVLNGQYFLHLYRDNKVIGHGKLALPSEILKPTVSEVQIQKLVLDYLKEKKLGKLAPMDLNESHSIKEKSLVYWQRKKDQKWFLVYKTKVLVNGIEPWELLIDSENGSILKEQAQHCGFHHAHESEFHDLIKEAGPHSNAHRCQTHATAINKSQSLSPETAKAIDLNGIMQTINVWREGQDVYCIDGSRPMFQPGQFTLNNPIGAIWTLDAMNSTNPQLNQIIVRTNSWAPVAVSAHHNAGKVYEYFLNTFNRNSIDGMGGTIRSYINFGLNYSGAFWSGGAIYYGNGNATKGYLQFAKGIDISAHEMSHGLIDASAGLEYDAESGAINESMADIFACMVDRDDWTLGEDIIVPGHPIRPSGVERNMANPGQGLPKDSFRLGWQPNHVNQQYFGLNDAGGVHWNSGIPNHAFYLFVQALITQSGSEENAKKIAEQIYYHALLFYLTRQADFKELRAAIEQSCLDLYPANTIIAQLASDAFEMVGITGGAEPGGGIFDFGQNNLKTNPGTEHVVCTKANVNTNRNEGVYLRNMATQDFKQLSNLNIICKPAVTDDGKSIYFVATDFKVYKLEYNPSLGTYEQKLLINNAVHRYVNVSKDGRFLALLESPAQNNNQIKILDLITSTSKSFAITNPVLQTGISNSMVTQIGSVDFDHSGRYLLYDGLSTYSIVNGNSFQQWDLGVLRFWDSKTDQFGDGAIEKVFRAPLADISQNVIYHFRNPVFSKNSPAIIAFDFYLGNFSNQTYSNTNSIVGAHLEKGELKYLQQGLGGLSYPNFSMEDDSLSFDHAYIINNRPPTRIQTFGLQPSKLDSSGTSRLFLNGYRWANRFGNEMRKLVNSLPVAVQDKFSTDEDVNIIGSVAANDVPGNDFPFMWKPVGNNGGALFGTLNMDINGNFTYIPNPNYYGPDAFSYEVCDVDQECQQAKVVIDIRSVDDLPIAMDDAGTTKQNVNLEGNVSANDVVSGDGGNSWKLDVPNGGAMGGTVNLDPNGQFVYIPNTDFYGNDQFVYSLCDADQDCSVATVKITVEKVNTVPIAVQDQFSMDEDMILNENVAINDAPGKDGPFLWRLIGLNGGAMHGTTVMNPDGTFSYTPSPNYFGSDIFSYEVCDVDQECSRSVVNLTIRSVNDLPLASDDVGLTKMNEALNGNVTNNDVASGDGGNYWSLDNAQSGPNHGTVDMNSNGDYIYTPSPGFFGADEFGYKLCDNDQDCAFAKVLITIEQIVGTNQNLARSGIRILSNPVKEKLVLVYDKAVNDKIQCSLFDILGNEVYQKEFFNVISGQRYIELDVSEINSGWYMLHVQGNHRQYVDKIIIVK